jgi:hypothetical protein
MVARAAIQITGVVRETAKLSGGGAGSAEAESTEFIGFFSGMI